MFIIALCTITKMYKQSKFPLINEWIKLWYFQTMECYSTIKNNKELIHVIMRMNLGNIMLRKIILTQKHRYYMVSHT